MKGRLLRTFLKGLGFLALSLGVSFVLFHLVWQPFQVYGSSMAPTLVPGDYLLVDRVWFRQSEIRRGDLVLFRLDDDAAFFVKRVVGLEGDTVEWKDGAVTVNGESWPLPPGTRAARDGLFETWVVPPATVFCLGDNLPASQDSRSFGPVGRDRLYGRAVLCYLPLSRWRWLGAPSHGRGPAGEAP